MVQIADGEVLTDRQLEILRHLARGDSVKAVARKLFLSPKSVDNQKFRIMNKIGVRDKVSLALFAWILLRRPGRPIWRT